jgi:CHAT domain-containing protein
MCWILLFSICLNAQCPVQDQLYQRLVYLSSHESSVPTDQQLEELTGYQQCRYQHDSIRAFLLQQIAALFHKKEEYYKSIQYSRAAIWINYKKPSGMITRPGNLIKSYFNLGDCYRALNRTGEQMNAIDSCILLAIKLKQFDEIFLYALWQRVNFLFDVGDYQRCITYTAMSAAAPVRLLHDENDYYNRFLNMQVNALLGLHQYEPAEKLLRDQLTRFNLLSRDYTGPVYAQMAEVEASKKNYEKALFFYQKALRANQRIHYDLGCLQILVNIGYNLYYLPKRDPGRALACYKKAMKFTDAQNQSALLKFETLNLFTNIANVFAEKNEYDSAFNYFQLAFDQIMPGLKEESLLTIPLDSFITYKRMNYLTAMLIDKGDACLKAFYHHHQQERLKEALQIYKVTDRLLDRIKAEQSELGSRLFWRKDSRRLYEHAIEASRQDHDMSNAFYFFEKGRAVLLSDLLNQQSTTSSDNMLTEAQLKKKLLQLKWEQDTLSPASKRYTEVRSELFTGKIKLDELDKTIREESPLYYQSFLDTASISLQDVRTSLLKDHQALLELFTGDSAVYSLLITLNDIRLNKINKADFDSLAGRYIAYISNAALLNREFDKYLKTAAHLYSLIFQDNPPPRGRIIVSPDIHYFPFESLVINDGLAPPVYFLKDHAVSYTYSARYLLNNFPENVHVATESFLGVAPVRYPSPFPLPSLDGSDLSLRRITNYFNKATMLTEEEAVRSRFLNQYTKYKIIQLYTHASDSSRNGEPVIYFADSALYLSELIPEARPGTRLIVVSACETANGRIYEGEGVFSFNRAFASLGIPSSIANLWSVDNKATYRITERFYKYLSGGEPTDIALQKAKLEFISDSKENSLPFYWAAAILSGRSEILAGKKKTGWPYIALVSAGIAAFSFFGWRKWKKNV